MSRIPITVTGSVGEEDENAIVLVSEDGITIDSADLGTISLSWSDLKKIFDDPLVEEMLENAEQDW